MDTCAPAADTAQTHGRPRPRFHPGDLVLLTTDYPMLCEVLGVQENGLIRIRGVGWPSGYSVFVGVQEIRHATGILAGGVTKH